MTENADISLLIDQLVQTWEIHDRINRYLLNAIDEEQLSSTSASKGRTVAEQFAHLHNVRLMWIKAANPVLLEGLDKLDKGDSLTKDSLCEALDKSATAIALLLKIGFEQDRIKGFKPHPSAFLGYLISHESHHRGQITLSLKQAGFPVDKKIQYGMWEWGSR